jgi:hypothetical protein
MLFAIMTDLLIYMPGRDMSYFPRNLHSLVHSDESVLTWPKDRLLALYNRNSEIPKREFATQEEAAESIKALLSDFSLEAIPMKRNQKTEETASQAETEAGTEQTEKKTRASSPRIPKEAKIKLKATANPKRAGSEAHKRFALYVDGMTVGDFLEAGGLMGDINFDLGKGFIEVEGVEAPTKTDTAPAAATPASESEQAAAA